MGDNWRSDSQNQQRRKAADASQIHNFNLLNQNSLDERFRSIHRIKSDLVLNSQEGKSSQSESYDIYAGPHSNVTPINEAQGINHYAAFNITPSRVVQLQKSNGQKDQYSKVFPEPMDRTQEYFFRPDIMQRKGINNQHFEEDFYPEQRFKEDQIDESAIEDLSPPRHKRQVSFDVNEEIKSPSIAKKKLITRK